MIGIDYGLARIGVALSDERKIIASPLSTFTTTKKLENTAKKFAEELRRLETEYQCYLSKLLIGLPLHMSGKASMLADEVKVFAELLTKEFPITIVFWDERLSTMQATRMLRDGGLTRLRQSKIVDKVTAAIILQSYLDSLPSQQKEP